MCGLGPGNLVGSIGNEESSNTQTRVQKINEPATVSAQRRGELVFTGGLCKQESQAINIPEEKAVDGSFCTLCSLIIKH